MKYSTEISKVSDMVGFDLVELAWNDPIVNLRITYNTMTLNIRVYPYLLIFSCKDRRV